MNRFRKKSDAKRPQFPLSPGSSEDRLPELPPVSDFRTSLILPDLSRRFTLLRTSTGEALSVDALKSQLAEQRARGAVNHVTEEEEDMIFESLGLRSKSPRPTTPQGSAADSDAFRDRFSAQSTDAMSYLSSPSTPRSTKRYSNNLFGSGRLRDYSYLRSVQRSPGRARSPSEVEEEPDHIESTLPNGPDEKLGTRSAPLIPPAPYREGNVPMDPRLSKTLDPGLLKRASVAFENAIREIEEEAEDEILVPRSAPMTRLSFEQNNDVARDSTSPRASLALEPGIAMTSDSFQPTSTDNGRPLSGQSRASPVPSRTVPGYIPGMPRPMTPRENMDLEDQRSHSTTPRASSPTSAQVKRESMSSPRPSIANSFSGVGGSPMFLQRSPNGRISPYERKTNDGPSASFQFPTNRNRPASPLSGSTFQPMTMASSSSRPSTSADPIRATSPVTSVSSKYSSVEHRRDDSWLSETNRSDLGSVPSHGEGPRSLKSPALPDSPDIDRPNPNWGSMNGPASAAASNGNSTGNWGSVSSPSTSFDVGSPAASTSIPTSRSPPPPTESRVSAPSPATSPTQPAFPRTDEGSKRVSTDQGTVTSPRFNFDFSHQLFSPIANSSRSSLESEGSSYHSDSGGNKDHLLSKFFDLDSEGHSWHHLSLPNSSSSATSTPAGSLSPDEADAEDVIRRYAGLKKADFLAIQDKLFGSAIMKHSGALDAVNRSQSLRRRRPSTSQSNYSLLGRDLKNAGFSLQPLNTSTSSSTAKDLGPSSHTALLHAIVDGMESSSADKTNHSSDDSINSFEKTEPYSPSTNRRNRDLAEVLFGLQDQESSSASPPDLSGQAASEAPSAAFRPVEDDARTSPPPVIPRRTFSPPPRDITPRPEVTAPLQLSKSFSSSKSPPRNGDQAQLELEVQRKAEAAMAALNKQPSASIGRNPPTLKPVIGSIRKRVSPNQISTPTLVSASTSVDTIPLKTAPAQSGSKMSARLKKLTGTLRRSQPLPTGEEVTPYPLSTKSAPSPATQTIGYTPDRLVIASTSNGQSSAGLPEDRQRANIPSPPASAGPGLKGFMARIRGKHKEDDVRGLHHTSLSVQSQSTATLPRSERLGRLETHPEIPQSPPATAPRVTSPPPTLNTSIPTSDESQALKQLFDAASNLGLDQEQLNELLVRSGSVSSKSTGWTMLNRSDSRMASSRPDLNRSPEPYSPTPQPQARSEFRQSVSTKTPVLRDPTRRPRENVGGDTASVVVRRTLYLPSENASPIPAPVPVSPKRDTKHKRRSSITSTSTRSVQERVPTPPPPKSAKRISTDNAPPVPALRGSGQQNDGFLSIPNHNVRAGGALEHSNSAYDSLYDMYGEQRRPGTVYGQNSSQRETTFNPGSGLEIIELANGEVIWNIVNNLRGGDTESIYGRRVSVSSEYSTRESNEGMRVFVKEHERGGSKGSASSFNAQQNQPQARPHTQVYVTPSAQIGRLIENLSQGMESGSFKFAVNDRHGPSGHSQSSSFAESEWTVERKLDEMLGAMQT